MGKTRLFSPHRWLVIWFSVHHTSFSGPPSAELRQHLFCFKEPLTSGRLKKKSPLKICFLSGFYFIWGLFSCAFSLRSHWEELSWIFLYSRDPTYYSPASLIMTPGNSSSPLVDLRVGGEGRATAGSASGGKKRSLNGLVLPWSWLVGKVQPHQNGPSFSHLPLSLLHPSPTPGCLNLWAVFICVSFPLHLLLLEGISFLRILKWMPRSPLPKCSCLYNLLSLSVGRTSH